MNWKKLLVGTWSWKRPFYTLAWVYFLLALFAVSCADKIIFQPPGTLYPENRAGFSSIDEEGKKIALFHLPAAKKMPTLFWSHGNAQNLESLRPALESLHLAGYGVISYDYPGYGESPGSPSEKECYRAIEATYQHLVTKLAVPPEKIILVGQSVGSGPTCWLAAREKHHAVVLISPFLSAFRTVTKIPLLPGDIFPNLKHIKNFQTPLLVIHGEDDRVIPFAHGKRLFELSPSPQKTFYAVAGAGHNDLFVSASLDLPSLIRDQLWTKQPES